MTDKETPKKRTGVSNLARLCFGIVLLLLLISLFENKSKSFLGFDLEKYEAQAREKAAVVFAHVGGGATFNTFANTGVETLIKNFQNGGANFMGNMDAYVPHVGEMNTENGEGEVNGPKVPTANGGNFLSNPWGNATTENEESTNDEPETPSQDFIKPDSSETQTQKK